MYQLMNDNRGRIRQFFSKIEQNKEGVVIVAIGNIN